MARVFISYTGHAKPDADLAAFLADHLSGRQHDIFIQTKIAPGQSWPAVAVKVRCGLYAKYFGARL